MENSSNFVALSENLNFNQVIKTQLVYFYTHCHVKFGGNLVSDKLFIGSIKTSLQRKDQVDRDVSQVKSS